MDTCETKPNRPRDSNQLAKLVVGLATGQAEENFEKDPAAVARGRKGGLACGSEKAAGMTASELSSMGRDMADARWGQE